MTPSPRIYDLLPLVFGIGELHSCCRADADQLAACCYCWIYKFVENHTSVYGLSGAAADAVGRSKVPLPKGKGIMECVRAGACMQGWETKLAGLVSWAIQLNGEHHKAFLLVLH